MQLGIVVGKELLELQLHWASYPTKSKRPEMISMRDADAPAEPSSDSTKLELITLYDYEPRDLPAPRSRSQNGTVKRKPKSDDELVAMHIEAQALMVHGETPAAVDAWVDLLREVRTSLDVDCWDRDLIDIILDQIHCRAYPDASVRPARLVIEGGGDPRE